MGITAKQEYFFPKENFLSLDMLVILLVAKPLTSGFGSFNQKNKITKLKSIGLDIDMILFIFLHVLINNNYIVFDVSVFGSTEHNMLKASF